MANTIILKKSSTVAKVPAAGDLQIGELAVNLADQKLYSKNASGTVVLVGQGTGGAGDVVGPSSATDNALTRFDGTTGKLVQNSAVTLDDSGNMTGLLSEQWDIVATPPTVVAGLEAWDDGNGTLEVGLKGGNVSYKYGQQEFARVYNGSGVTMTKGQVVLIIGAQGNRVDVRLATANNDANSAGTIGLVAESIANGAEGFVQVSGTMPKLNTNGLTAGATIYLSPTVAGAYTTTKPSAPQHTVILGWIERVSSTVGSIYIKVDNGYELDELHNVAITSPTSGNTLIYDAVQGVWENSNLSAGTGISVTNGAGSITIANTAPDQTVALTGAGTTTVTGTYPNFTITSADQYQGTVTSVSGTGTVSGLTLSGTVTGSGNLTLGGSITGFATSGANTNLTSVALTTGTISTTPSGNNDIVNKSYADSLVAGVNFHPACNYATTAALPANTYNNGSSGVGATLTATANGTLTVDGYTFVAGDVGKRILVKNETPAADNGAYTLTQAGTASLPYILTRATDFDTVGSGQNEIAEGDLFLIISGTANANTQWVQQTAAPITVGTTPITFIQFGSGTAYSAGTGLTLTGNTFSVTNQGTAGTYGSASTVPVFTTNAQGQVTAVTNTNIAIAGSAVTGNITGNAANVTGTVAVAKGGTGLTSTPANGALDIGNGTGFTRTTLTQGSGISITNGAGTITIAATGGAGVTSVTGTSPVVSSGGTTPAISLAAAYGDTLNPYASKTANQVLAAPNGTTGVPTFRAIVAADIPTLNQNTTGSSGSCTGNAATATVLQTARTIGGVSFNGSANINLPGVNAAGNQNTTGSSGSCTGNAATATVLQTARTIGGVSFNGSANINLPGVNAAGNQNTTGSSGSCTGNAATATTATNQSGGTVSATTGTFSSTVQGPNFCDATGTYNVNLGSGGTAGRGVVAGYSGGSYSGIGFNIRHTATGATYIAPTADTTSYLLFNAAGFTFQGAAAGTAGRTLALTTLMTLSSAGALVATNNVTAFSDERVKTNWRDLQPDFIEQLAKVKHGIYDRTDQVSTQVGVGAQSLRPVLEHAIMEDGNGRLSVAYGNAALVSAIKLAERVVELTDKLAVLEAKLEQLSKG